MNECETREVLIDGKSYTVPVPVIENIAQQCEKYAQIDMVGNENDPNKYGVDFLMAMKRGHDTVIMCKAPKGSSLDEILPMFLQVALHSIAAVYVEGAVKHVKCSQERECVELDEDAIRVSKRLICRMIEKKVSEGVCMAFEGLDDPAWRGLDGIFDDDDDGPMLSLQ